MSYVGNTLLISGVRAKTGDFPVASAADIYVDDDTRLDDIVPTAGPAAEGLSQGDKRAANAYLFKQALDGKANAGDVPTAYTNNPEMAGTADPGSGAAYAKGDHVHPAETRIDSYSLPADCFPIKYQTDESFITGDTVATYTVNSNDELRFVERSGLVDVWHDASGRPTSIPFCSFSKTTLKFYREVSPVTIVMFGENEDPEIPDQWPSITTDSTVFVRDVSVAKKGDLDATKATKADKSKETPVTYSLPSGCLPVKYNRASTGLQYSTESVSVEPLTDRVIALYDTNDDQHRPIAVFDAATLKIKLFGEDVVQVTFADTDPTFLVWPALAQSGGTFGVVYADDIAGLAPLASPAFTGTPTAPDPSLDSPPSQIANLKYVNALVDTESPLVARSFTSASSGTAGNGNGSALYFKPSYLGMANGDRFKEFIVQTRSDAGSSSAKPVLYARLRRFSDKAVLAHSNKVAWPGVPNTEVCFTFADSVTLPNADNNYYVDFVTEPDDNPSSDYSSLQIGLNLYNYGTNNDGLYFQLKNLVPKITVHYYSWAADSTTLAGKLDSSSAAPAWVSGTAYAAKALVTYNGVTYRCKADTVSPHTATPSADATHWEAKPVSDLFLPLTGGTMTGGLTVPNLTVGSRTSGSTIGTNSVAEGTNTTASGYYSHAEGYNTTASGTNSHAEGYNTTASGTNSHAEGSYTTASGDDSHAEGGNTTATGTASHAENNSTTASGDYSHAEGSETTASGRHSHAEGFFTTSQNEAEHAQGKYNASHTVVDSSFGDPGNTLSSIGFGTTTNGRKNAVETMQDGKTYIYGVGGYNGTNPTASGVKDLATAVNSMPSAYTNNPAMAGMASPGSGTAYARGNHVHPAETRVNDYLLPDDCFPITYSEHGGLSFTIQGNSGLRFEVYDVPISEIFVYNTDPAAQYSNGFFAVFDGSTLIFKTTDAAIENLKFNNIGAEGTTYPTLTNGKAVVVRDVEVAPLASPAFTGTPTAPTPVSGDNSTNVATTAFVQNAMSGITPGPDSTKANSTAIAPAWSNAAVSYAVGQTITYNGNAYECMAAYTTDAQSLTPDQDIYDDSTTPATGHWKTTDMTTPDATLDVTSAGSLRVVAADGTVLWQQGYKLKTESSSTLDNEAGNRYGFAQDATDIVALTLPAYPAGKVGDFILAVTNPQIGVEFSSTDSYAEGARVIYQGAVYTCSTPHTGEWSAGDFTLVYAAWDSETSFPYETVVAKNGSLYKCREQAGSTVGWYEDEWTTASFDISGLGSTVEMVVPEGQNLNEILTFAPGAMCELYFTLTSFAVGGLPTWKVVRQDVEAAV